MGLCYLKGSWGKIKLAFVASKSKLLIGSSSVVKPPPILIGLKTYAVARLGVFYMTLLRST